MKKFGLNPHEHLRDSIGSSIGTINRAFRARKKTAEILESTTLPSNGYWISTNEDYNELFVRAVPIHNQRKQEIEVLLQELTNSNAIEIEDGGIKSEQSLKRKLRDKTSKTYNMARASDLSRMRIVVRDLNTMLEVIRILKDQIGKNPNDTYVAWIRSSYKRTLPGKSLFSGVFFNILSKSVKQEVEDYLDGDTLDDPNTSDISTEIQIVTRRVRDVSEGNRESYSNLKKRGIDNEYNKTLLRAIILDWKEYFTQRKENK